MHGARPLRSTRRIQNLVSTLPKWYSVKNQAAGLPTIVSIYDEIGMFGVSAQVFMEDLRQVQGDIELHLNSPGGDVFDGIAIYNMLRQRGNVSVVIDGLAASAASFIAQAAAPGKLEIASHAEMMIHDGFAMAIGNANDMRELADQLDRVSDNIAGIYAERTGKPVAYWREKMRAETWLSDRQAVAEGLADRIYGEDTPRNSWDLSVYRNASGGNAGWVERDGKWAFDPDGDGDDDSSPETDSDHDYWDENGRQLKSIPPNPATGKGGKPLAPGNKAGQPYEPLPYHRDPDENVQCPVCHKYDDTDARYCDQCGTELVGRKDVSESAAANQAAIRWLNADKYKQSDRDEMAKSGEAMPDGSYPIADAEDLDNAIHAVGRGSGDHDDIRRHIIKRAKALGLSERIPDNWNADGSLQDRAEYEINASALQSLLASAL